jgi:hypothetical protein
MLAVTLLLDRDLGLGAPGVPAPGPMCRYLKSATAENDRTLPKGAIHAIWMLDDCWSVPGLMTLRLAVQLPVGRESARYVNDACHEFLHR